MQHEAKFLAALTLQTGEKAKLSGPSVTDGIPVKSYLTTARALCP